MRHSELFPYAIARTAGGSLRKLNQLNLKRTIIILKNLEIVQKEIDVLKVEISEKLHTVIGNVADKKKRFSLIQLRRDIFNEKSNTLDSLDAKSLPSQLQTVIERYLKLQKQKQQHLIDGEKYFSEEVKKSRKIFLKLLKNSNFQNGITLSSSTLQGSLDEYVKKSGVMVILWIDSRLKLLAMNTYCVSSL